MPNRDISIGINARNNATPAFEGAARGLQKLDAALASVRSRIHSFAGNLLAGLSVGKVFADVFQNIQEDEKTLQRLNTALRVSGQNAAAVVPQMQSLADAMQRSLLIHKDNTLQLIEHAVRLGLDANAAQQASITATGLAQVYGIDVHEALEKVQAALVGKTVSLQRLIPELKVVTDQNQFWAIVQEKAALGLQLTSDATDNHAAAVQRLKLAYEDFIDLLSDTLIPVLDTMLLRFHEAQSGMKMMTVDLMHFLGLISDEIHHSMEKTIRQEHQAAIRRRTPIPPPAARNLQPLARPDFSQLRLELLPEKPSAHAPRDAVKKAIDQELRPHRIGDRLNPALESRFLTSAPGQDPTREIARHTRNLVDLTRRQAGEIAEIKKELKDAARVKVK